MELISKAVLFATQAHDNMRRKGSPTPYILHPLEAAVIVGTMTNDQEIMAAAALHDVIEDADITAEEIEKEFGVRVKELVLSETEDKRPDVPPEESWRARKEEAIEALQKTKDEAVKILYLGDKLSNLRAIDRDLTIYGSALWQRFNQKDPQMHKWYYRAVADGTKDLKDTQAWQELDRLIVKVFGDRKE